MTRPRRSGRLALDVRRRSAKTSHAASARAPEPARPRATARTTDARPLALFRVAIATMGLFVVGGYAPYLVDTFSDEGFLPRAAMPARDPLEPGGLLAMVGEPWQVVAYWAVTMLALGALLVGLRTRAASVASWLLVVGFHERNWYPLDGSDTLLRVMLFWLVFADAGWVASVDAHRRGRAERAESVPALPVRLLELQLAWMYLSAFLQKLAGAYWRDGTAVRYALMVPSVYARSWAAPLAESVELVRALTYGTMAFELAFPVLVLASYRRPRLRTVALGAGLVFHAGIELLMNVGNFPLVALACYALLAPPAWADRPLAWLDARVIAPLARRFGPLPPDAPRGPSRWRRRGAVVLALHFGLVVWASLPPPVADVAPRIPDPLRVPVELTGTGQIWDMFAPVPMLGDVRVRGEGRLVDGTAVDPLRDAPGGPIVPERAGFFYSRWAKILSLLAFAPDDQVQPFGRYVCRRWNGDGRTPRSLERYELVRVHRRTAPPGQPQPGYRHVVFWTHHCY